MGELIIVAATALCMALDNWKLGILDDPKRRAMVMSAVWFALIGFGIAISYAVAGDKVHDNQYDWTDDRPKPEYETLATGYFIVSIVSAMRVWILWTGCCANSKSCELVMSALLGIGGIIVAAGYWMFCEWYAKDDDAERAGAVGMSFFMLIMIGANCVDMAYSIDKKEFISVQ